MRERRRANPYAHPAQRAPVHRRHEHPRAARDRGPPRPRPAARDDGRVRAPAACPACSARDRPASRSRSPSPRASPSRLDGNELRWQNWSMRLGFNSREGPVIHTLGYATTVTAAPVAHRMSFAEMVVPYRDPAPTTTARTAFDIGEWGLGFMTTSLELGCDCLGEIRYLDAVVHDAQGRAAGRSRTRSASTRRTTPSCGSTSTRVRAPRCAGCAGWSSRSTPPSPTTSTSSTGASTRTATSSARSAPPASWSPRRFAEGEQPPYGTLVDERTYAPFHQHFLVARLDLDVDGEDNTVVESTREAPPICAGQPATASRSCTQRPRCAPRRRARGLRLGDPAGLEGDERRARNGLGTPVGYKLVPGGGDPGDARPGLAGVPARAGDRAHALGHAATTTTSAGRAATTRRRASEDSGLPGVDRGRPPDREHRRRALVRLRHPPHHPRRGLAGDAGRHGLVLAQAVRLLRPQPALDVPPERRADPRRGRRRARLDGGVARAPGGGAHSARAGGGRAGGDARCLRGARPRAAGRAARRRGPARASRGVSRSAGTWRARPTSWPPGRPPSRRTGARWY